MRLGREGFAFIVENRSDGSRRIIAHPDAPDSLRLTTSASDGRGQDALPAEEIDDPRVHALLPLVPGHDEDSSPGMQTIHASVGPVEYTGGILKLKGSDQPDWLICMMIPEDEILGQIHRMNKLTFLIAFGGVIVSVALGFWLASRMARHLQRVVQETHEIAQFRLMPKEFKPSAIKEIGRLETSFEEMKSGLRSFQKYVPADLVRNILASGQEAKLGGSRRRITVFFSDIASFTKISEQLPPEILIDVLSDYLNQMTQVMLDAGATVDKYIGDAIMAFWGAPHDQTDAALKACYAALGNQHQLIDLRAKWKASGLPEIRARIGLHTGEALVGNFGSENRLDYTAIGDTVNLAHRLEGLNEHYGTDILISEATRLEVGNQFLVRCIDRVAVKGREAGTIIFELIKPLDEADAREIAFCTEFESALNQYFQADFDSAQKAFEEILKQYPDDGPGREMLRRCMLYAENPPPDDWDGIWRMVTK
jgi:adenylate cyclase